jgi:thymidylate synthase
MTMILNDSIVTNNFSKAYPTINKYMMENASFQYSRNGDTKEILDFKTKITNPYKRCVGNNGRNINIFFLMAEAMWIFAGKKDLETLQIFNSQMAEYSDDNESFHAPYGFRIRHAGLSSFDKTAMPITEENAHAVSMNDEGRDQMLDVLIELDANPETRQVVLQIWNQELDLSTKTKDKPCNDIVFLKIREGKLITTIGNRSNDLHWGLPTNVYQFSFQAEIMSDILGISMGTQTHNSHSLHFYLKNPIADNMYENLQFNPEFEDLYDVSRTENINFLFEKEQTIEGKLSTVDYCLNAILKSFLDGKPLDGTLGYIIRNICPTIMKYHDLCHVYLSYKINPNKTDFLRMEKIEEIYALSINSHDNKLNHIPLDIEVLAQNFFLSRVKDASVLQDNKIFSKNSF